jgi:Fe-S oxidoreductase
MTGQIKPGEAVFGDPDVDETLSLCLGCKACRYECPSQVDVTKLKAEYDAQRWAARGGAPWRVRMKASIRSINRLGGSLHRVANVVSRQRIVAWATKRMLGVHTSRTLPTFGPPLTRWARKRKLLDDAPVVLLYEDCFTTWNDPAIGRSAIRLLEAFGYRVVVPKSDCCGRTNCSAGRLDKAASQIAKSATAVRNAMLKHNASVVLAVEPSCATTLQQEWTELDLGDAQRIAQQVSEASDTVEGFLLRHWGQHPQHPKFTTTSFPVVLHVHCHQKHRSADTKQFLERCGFSDVELLDSGCCGMAGSFGYDKNTFDLSMRIAEQSLGDAIRSRRGAIVAANGTSCRHQIGDAFDVESRHPLELVHGALRRIRR